MEDARAMAAARAGDGSAFAALVEPHRLARDDVAGEVARVTEQPGEQVVSVGGAGFAYTLIELGLVDEYRLFINPIVLGGGTPYFPRLEQRTELELLETRTFCSRVVYARYGVLRRRVRDRRAGGRAHP